MLRCMCRAYEVVCRAKRPAPSKSRVLRSPGTSNKSEQRGSPGEPCVLLGSYWNALGSSLVAKASCLSYGLLQCKPNLRVGGTQYVRRARLYLGIVDYQDSDTKLY